jgi:hypothetical protein
MSSPPPNSPPDSGLRGGPYLSHDEILALLPVLQCPPVQQLAIWGSALEQIDRRLAGYWTIFLLSDLYPPQAPRMAENPPTTLSITLEPGGPQLRISSPGMAFTARVWLWRLYDGQTPGYADLRWVPPGRFMEVIELPGGPDWLATPKSINQLWQGLRVLVHQVRRGRPRGGPYASAEECRHDIVRALQRIPHGQRWTKQAVGLALSGDASGATLRRWLKEYGVRWEDCLTAAKKTGH